MSCGAKNKVTMRDVDQIIRIVSAWSDVEVQQLQVTHSGADDDGLWFFTLDEFESRLNRLLGCALS